MGQRKNNHTTIYRIRLKSLPSRAVIDWLGDITLIPQANGETVLIGRFADQAALRGCLVQLWNLNCTILSIERIENGKT